MHARVESQYSPWKLVKEELKPILLGLAFGTIVSAIFPLIKAAFERGNQWIRDLHHIDSNGLPAAVISIAALAVFVWPGPILLQWSKSFGKGVIRGSFAVPAVAAFCALGLRYRLPVTWWEISIPVIGIVAFSIIYLPYRRSVALEVADDRSDEPRISLKDAWPERRALAHEIARHILDEGKATYAVYGGFGAGKSSMLNFISGALRGNHGRRAILVRFNGWLPGSRENLADQLLSDIATECSREYWTPHFRRTALRVAKTLKTAVPHTEWIAEWLPQETQQDAIDDLRNALKRLPCRVVVLVDEMDRMETQYGPEKGLKDVDLNFSYWLAFSDWGILLEKSVWARDRNIQQDFWNRYISSPERMASFARYVLAPFALQLNMGAPTSSHWKHILPEEDLRKLAMTYPPYQDMSAVSYLRELLGESVIPEPIRMGPAKPNSEVQADLADE